MSNVVVRRPSMSWVYKSWEQFNAQDKALLANHLTELTEEQRGAYLNYLHHWCGMPKEISL